LRVAGTVKGTTLAAPTVQEAIVSAAMVCASPVALATSSKAVPVLRTALRQQ
jgi:hypothetical protein